MPDSVRNKASILQQKAFELFQFSNTNAKNPPYEISHREDSLFYEALPTARCSFFSGDYSVSVKSSVLLTFRTALSIVMDVPLTVTPET